MTAAAIASRRAMIDFHGRVLRLTRATWADRSICLSCTRDSSFRATRPNAIRREAGGAGRPGTTTEPRNKCWGPAGPQHLPDLDDYLISGGPTGNLSLPPMPFEMPAADVYQATTAVRIPTYPPALTRPVLFAKPPMNRRISVSSRVRKTRKTAVVNWVLRISRYVLTMANASRIQALSCPACNAVSFGATSRTHKPRPSQKPP